MVDPMSMNRERGEVLVGWTVKRQKREVEVGEKTMLNLETGLRAADRRAGRWGRGEGLERK